MAVPPTPSSESKIITTVFPARKSDFPPLKLTVFDLCCISFSYIQKGGVFRSPPFPIPELISRLKSGLSQALTYFPPLAGRFTTGSDGYLYVTSNDAGVDFIHAVATDVSVSQILVPSVPDEIRSRCYSYDGVGSYEGDCRPLMAVQVTELADGVYVGISMSHGVVDGTSYWHFFNCFAELSRGLETVSKKPDFSRDLIPVTKGMPKIPRGGTAFTAAAAAAAPDPPQYSQIMFSFSRESIRKLKVKVNSQLGEIDSTNPRVEISSFQSLSALLCLTITRARKLPPSTKTVVMMAINCRHRLEPKLDPLYFGNGAFTVPTFFDVGDLVGRDLRWGAEQLNKTLVAYDNTAVRKYIDMWERNPVGVPLFSMGDFSGPIIIIGSSPRFPMYDNDFGWGRPVAVGCRKTATLDGVIVAYPGREGNGSVVLDVSLPPDTMAIFESDPEFVQYVSRC